MGLYLTTGGAHDPFLPGLLDAIRRASEIDLADGLEWNIRVDRPSSPDDRAATRFNEIRTEFKTLLEHPHVRPLNHDWIDTYEQRRRVVQQLPILPGDEPEELPPQPSSIQSAALEALLNTRAVGYKRGLVVMATGLGKTYLAAFDTEQMAAKRVLFVAHREEILLQAEESFQRVRPNTLENLVLQPRDACSPCLWSDDWNLAALGGAEQNVLDDLGAGIGVVPDVHRFGDS